LQWVHQPAVLIIVKKKLPYLNGTISNLLLAAAPDIGLNITGGI